MRSNLTLLRLYAFTPQPVRPKAALPAMGDEHQSRAVLGYASTRAQEQRRWRSGSRPVLTGQNLVNGHLRLGSLGLVLGGLALSVQGCHEPWSENVGTSASPLEVQVSTAFDVENYPTAFATSQPERISFACGSERCFAVHRLRLDDGTSWVLGTRIDAAGKVLDAPRIAIAEGEFATRVVARADEFLVITAKTETSEAGPYAYYRVRGSDGLVTRIDAAGLPQSGPVIGSSTGNSWILVSPNAGSGVRAQVYDLDFKARGSGAVLESALIKTISSPVPGPGQYALAAYGRALRIDEATGNPLDAQPIVLSAYASVGSMPGVFVDGVYQFVYGSKTSVLGTRLEAQTGVVLDPDDTFNEVPGPKLLADLSSTATGNLDVDRIGGDVVVTATLVNDQVSAVRVDPKTETSTSTNASYAALENSIVGDATHELHVLGNTVFVVDTQKLLMVGTKSVSWRADFATPKLALGVPSFDRFRCKVASSGSGYLVVFARGSGMYQQGSEILATRIHPTTGAYLDDPPLKLGVGEYPAVASDGKNYLVSWLSTEDATTRAHWRVVRADASLGKEDQAQIYDSVQGFEPNIAYNGAYYGVSWGTRAARIDAEGKFVSPDKEPADSIFYVTGLMAPLGEPGPRVAADTTPTPDRRTFLLVGEVRGALQTRNVAVRALRSATGALVGATTTIAEGHRSPFAISDGTRTLVVSKEEATGGWYGLFVDPTNVAAIPNTRKLMVEPTTNPDINAPPIEVNALFFDGTSYHLVVTERQDSSGRTAKTYLRRYDAALTRLAEEGSGAGTLLSSRFSPYQYMDAIAITPGRGLFVFQTVDVARLGTALKASFFASDGSTLPSVGAGGNANPGDAGGSLLGAGGSGGQLSGVDGSTSHAGAAGLANTEHKEAGASTIGEAGAANSGGDGGAKPSSGADAAFDDASGLGSIGSGLAGSGGGRPALPDGSAEADGGAVQDEVESGSSCGCRVSTKGSEFPAAVAAAILAIFIGARRRRSVQARSMSAARCMNSE